MGLKCALLMFLMLHLMYENASANNRPHISSIHVKKSTVEFYLHDKASTPGNTLVKVAGPKGNLTGVQFGTMVVIDDLLTEGPSPKSKQLGRAQGTYCAASRDTTTVFMSFSAVFEGKYNGSISFHGAEKITDKSRDVVVVGGTGHFMFAQGVATISTYSLNGLDAILHFKVKIHHI